MMMLSSQLAMQRVHIATIAATNKTKQANAQRISRTRRYVGGPDLPVLALVLGGVDEVCGGEEAIHGAIGLRRDRLDWGSSP